MFGKETIFVSLHSISVILTGSPKAISGTKAYFLDIGQYFTNKLYLNNCTELKVLSGQVEAIESMTWLTVTEYMYHKCPLICFRFS